MNWPWIALHEWKPFSIDALGLVTLLGSEEVDACIGRLVRSRYLEYMPLLAGFVVAGDRFKKKNPSFHLYNITSGIYTTDISFWFTRWMEAQAFEVTRSIVYWEIVETPRPWWPYHMISFAVSFCFTGFSLIMTTMSKDWYGIANSLAIIISIAVRTYVMQANRNAIDIAVTQACSLPGTYQHAVQKWQKTRTLDKPSEDARPDGKTWKPEQVKLVVVTSDAKMVTMFMPEKLLISVFVRNPVPQIGWLYHLVRWVGWVAFAVYIVALGMTKLANQMYAVALLVIPTVLLCWRVGCDDSTIYLGWKRHKGKSVAPVYSCYIGSHLKATVFEWPKDVEFTEGPSGWRRRPPEDIKSHNQRSERRQDLYAWLNLTAEEEKSLGKWDLLPHTRNDDNKWGDDYNAKKALIQGAPTDIQAVRRLDIAGTRNGHTTARATGGSQMAENQEGQRVPAETSTSNPLLARGPQRTNTGLSADGTVLPAVSN